MESKHSIYRGTMIWLLLPIFFVNSIVFAHTTNVFSVFGDNLNIEKSILSVDYSYSNSSNGKLPFETPANNEENSIVDIEDTLKIDVLNESISDDFTLCLTFKDISLSHLYLEPISLHHDILSPPPKK